MRKAIAVLALSVTLVPLEAAFRITPARVPSRYTATRTKIQAMLTDTRPIRWPGFGTGVQFFHRGSITGAANGGVDALQAALSAWTNDPDSNVALQHGGATTAGVAEDQTNTIIFNDPDGRIAGSYVNDRFEATGSLLLGRRQHTSTLLESGKALIAGGFSTVALNTAEVYDPVTGIFTPATGLMASPRHNHAAIRLDDGSPLTPDLVLVAGGSNGTSVLNSAERYDPVNNNFSPAGPMSTPRSEFTATAFGLPTKVLVAGGWNGTAAVATAEVYNQDLDSFSSTMSSMSSPRFRHAAALFSDQSPAQFILLTGGSNGTSTLSTAELFSPTTGTFSPAAGTMTTPRSEATATTTTTTQDLVVVIGGFNGTVALDTAEIYDIKMKTFSLAAGRMSTPRARHSATRLPNGQILVTGGTNGTSAVTTAEIFDPDTQVFLPVTPGMTTARAEHTATLLANGTVLVAGGGTNTAERYFSSPSRVLADVIIFFNDVAPRTFAGESFWDITEVDIVLQDGLTGPGLTNGGLARLIAHAIGVGLGFQVSPSPAVLNQTFDFENSQFGAVLQLYDLEALATVYPVCPTITTQPQSTTINSGQTATLSVATTGGDLTYQWFQGTTPVGTNSASLTTPALTSTTSFRVRVSNNCGFVESATATVTVATTVAAKGDANGDGQLSVADLIYLLNRLFASGPAPVGSADVNGDGQFTVADIFYLIHHLFSGGPPPV